MMLQPGDAMPHFDVTTIDGRHVAYDELWQRRNLLLVRLPPESAAADEYVSRLMQAARELTAHDTACVVTTDEIAGAPSPGVAIADRWGEIHFVTGASTAADLPAADSLVEWLRWVQSQCPECQGEIR